MLLSRWFVAALAALSFSLTGLGASAAEPRPYDAQAFMAAQAGGKPILLEVDASWCPICAKQRPILAELEKSAELSDLVVFTVDFDSQKDLLRQFGVQMQSTLIVYNGRMEKGRSTGVTDPGAIKALLLKSKDA
jgi:thioredoxin 1